MHTEDSRVAVAEITRWFESLSPQSLEQLAAFYTADARFKDPFNEVRGVPAITRIFEHMFTTLHGPRFVVTQQLVDGAQAFLAWEFRFHFTLAEDGRISEHRDYWAAAEKLYEKLPGLGVLMRWLKSKANS